MRSLMSLLKKKYRQYAVYDHAVEVITRNWSSLVGDLSAHLTPGNIYKNQLVVTCNNPMWLSELDYFGPVMVEKVNDLLIKKKLTVRVSSIKPVFRENDPVSSPQSPPLTVPDSLQARIKWRIELRKKEGATLCQVCQKVWDKQQPCRLCELTSS